MKKIILALVLATTALSAFADGRGGFHGGGGYHGGWHGGYHGGCYGCGWVAPAIIGGVIGYELAQPRTVIVQEPQVVYTQPAPVVQNLNCPINTVPLYDVNGIYLGCKQI